MMCADTSGATTTTRQSCTTQLYCSCQTNSDCKDWQGGGGFCSSRRSCLFCSSGCLAQDKPPTDISGASCVDVCCTVEQQTTDYVKSLCAKHGANLATTTPGTTITTVATSKCQRSKCTAARVCAYMYACADTTKRGFMFACISPYMHAYVRIRHMQVPHSHERLLIFTSVV